MNADSPDSADSDAPSDTAPTANTIDQREKTTMRNQFDNEPADSADAVESITVNVDHLSVKKQLAPYQNDVVKVTFTINSVRDEPVRLRLTDTLPDGVETDAVGFHPDYEPNAWSVADGRAVTYETVIDPGEERQTVYGARVESLDRLERFLVEPEIQLVAVQREADGSVPSQPTETGDSEMSHGDPNDGMASDDRQTDPSGSNPDDPPARDADRDDSGSEASPSQGDSPNAGAGTEPPGSDGSPQSVDGTASEGAETPTVKVDATTETDTAADPAAQTSVFDALVQELQQREPSEAERATLVEALGRPFSPSEQVRLNHVQESVDDLMAYRDALKGFIDEHGPADELIDDIQTTFDAHAAELESLESTLDELSSRLDALERTHDNETEELASRLSGLESEMTTDLSAIEEDLASVQNDLARVKEWREKLSVAAQLADAGVETDSVAD